MKDLCPAAKACRSLQAVVNATECDDLKLIVISDHEASRVLNSPGGTLNQGISLIYAGVNRLNVMHQAYCTIDLDVGN